MDRKPHSRNSTVFEPVIDGLWIYGIPTLSAMCKLRITAEAIDPGRSQ